jgi:hypothetical protein
MKVKNCQYYRRRRAAAPWTSIRCPMLAVRQEWTMSEIVIMPMLAAAGTLPQDSG